MSQFSIYLNAPDYLAQWLRHEYWSDENGRVEFPRGSAPRTVLSSFLKRQPRNAPQEDTAGLLPVEVPTFKGINPNTHNYVSDKGKTAIVSTCKRMFQNMLWNELHDLFTEDVQITDIIYAFMDRHGIEPEAKNWETIRQMYYRMRERTLQQ